MQTCVSVKLCKWYYNSVYKMCLLQFPSPVANVIQMSFHLPMSLPVPRPAHCSRRKRHNASRTVVRPSTSCTGIPLIGWLLADVLFIYFQELTLLLFNETLHLSFTNIVIILCVKCVNLFSSILRLVWFVTVYGLSCTTVFDHQTLLALCHLQWTGS